MTRRVYRPADRRPLELLNVWRAYVTVPGRQRMEFRGSSEQSAAVRAQTFARNLGHPEAEITTEPPSGTE